MKSTNIKLEWLFNPHAGYVTATTGLLVQHSGGAAKFVCQKCS
jgi:hypothetical protein